VGFKLPLFSDPKHREIIPRGLAEHGLYRVGRLHDDQLCTPPRRFGHLAGEGGSHFLLDPWLRASRTNDM
jgi:hypothetical protein